MSDSIEPAEAIGRFVKTFTGGKIATNKILQISNDKIETAVAEVEAEIARLQAAGVRSLSLNGMVDNLRAAHGLAFHRQGSGNRYDAFEKVKKGARAAAQTAKVQVDNILELLQTLTQTALAAWTAIKQAEAAIQEAPNPQQYAQALTDLEARHTAHSSVTESTEITPAIAELAQVKADAGLLAADVAASNALAALAAVEAEIGRLQAVGVGSISLDGTYANLRASHALALSGQNDAKRYEALQTVKQQGRAAAITAKKQVDNILARLQIHAQTSVGASTAIGQADAAIQQTPDPNEKQLYARTLADLRARHANHSGVTESTQITPATAELAKVKADAEKLAADVTAANALALDALARERTAKLLEIEKKLSDLRKLNQQVVDLPLQQFVQDKLAELTTRKDALAQAPLGQLQAELDKVPDLLQDIANAAKLSEQCGKWGKVKPLREMYSSACDHYTMAASANNKDKLRQDSETLRQKLEAVEKLASGPPPNPVEAGKKFVDEIKPAYNKIKEYYLDQILKGPLVARAEALEQSDPNSAEAQMKQALAGRRDPDTHRPLYETNLLEAWNTAEVFGSTLTSKLSPGEAAAIYTYTSDDYKKINGLLLGTRDPQSPDERDQIEIMIEQAKRALAKLDNYAGVSKRGDGRFNGDDAQFKLNNEFTIKAFWSTGVGFSFPGKWQIAIHGKTGKDVKTVSKYANEAEVLFPPGSKFRVIDRDDTEAPTTIYVTLEEV